MHGWIISRVNEKAASYAEVCMICMLVQCFDPFCGSSHKGSETIPTGAVERGGGGAWGVGGAGCHHHAILRNIARLGPVNVGSVIHPQ